MSVFRVDLEWNDFPRVYYNQKSIDFVSSQKR